MIQKLPIAPVQCVTKLGLGGDERDFGEYHGCRDPGNI